MPDILENRRVPYFGDFVLFCEIGRGGMGVVYNAQQTRLDRPVALKVLHSCSATGRNAMQRLRIEAEAAARLDHPNIVPIYEFGELGGQPYLAMQLVEGESLADYITRHGANLPEREAARLLAKIAWAVHHAHQRGVLHRDLKPGNILLDENGEPRLIDFGLAKCLEQESSLTQTGSLIGTPAYASPEQVSGQGKSVTTASDIYSLGAILYALLTGHPPFAGKSTAAIVEQAKTTSPRSPRQLRPQLGRDLEVICQKSLEKESSRRYGSALALAEELERFLDGKPITARPIGTLERLAFWAKRNPNQAALWSAGVLLVVLVLAGTVMWRDSRIRESEARNHIQRQELLDDIQRIRLTEHVPGWSTQAWNKAIAAAKIPTALKSGEMRDRAAALLSGLDARPIPPFTNFGASSVAFDLQGNRLLMGGVGDGAKLWDSITAKLQTATGTNLGPVAFLADGTGTQLLYDAKQHSLLLSCVVDSRTETEWKIPATVEDIPIRREAPKLTLLSRDGSRCVAVLRTEDNHERVLVLTTTGTHALGNPRSTVTAVAISADGSLVAVGESSGRVSVWSAYNATHVTEFMASRNEITSLALQQSARVTGVGKSEQNAVMLLAAGDSGGLTTIYELPTQTPIAHCRGGHYQVFTLAFSPDGMTLASGGRGAVKLWDFSTGRLLLDLPYGGSGELITGVDFAPDGKHLAISSQGGNKHPLHVSVWELEYGRGIQTLRGLSGQIAKICISADGKRFAAFSHNWEAGVWDLATGRLLRIFETPKGESADNAALALDGNGTRVAVAAQSATTVWNVQTGSELANWDLPPGLVNMMGFRDAEHLLLFRVETEDAITAPFSENDPARHPRVCRIRNLLSSDWKTPLAEIRDFSAGVPNAHVPLDAHCFVVEGTSTPTQPRSYRIKCFDGLTGKELWASPRPHDHQLQCVLLDPAGRVAAFRYYKSLSNTVVDTTTGLGWKELDMDPSALHLEPWLYAVNNFTGDGSARGISVFDGHRSTPLVTLGMETATLGPVTFDLAGTQLAWGNPDGTVTVCDLKRIHDRLSEAGLEW